MRTRVTVSQTSSDLLRNWKYLNFASGACWASADNSDRISPLLSNVRTVTLSYRIILTTVRLKWKKILFINAVINAFMSQRSLECMLFVSFLCNRIFNRFIATAFSIWYQNCYNKCLENKVKTFSYQSEIKFGNQNFCKNSFQFFRKKYIGQSRWLCFLEKVSAVCLQNWIWGCSSWVWILIS